MTMNKHPEFTAITMVAIITLSLFTAIAATPTIVEAHTATTVSLTASKTTPIIGQSVTFTATLKRWSSTAHTWVAYSDKPVTIYHYLNGVRYTDTTKTTNSYGKITLTQTFGSAGARTYYAAFAGDTTYAKATSSKVTVYVLKLWTQTTLTASKTKPYVGESVSFNAQLKRRSTTTNILVALSGKSITIWHYVSGIRVNDVTKTTNAYGRISWVKSWASIGNRYYAASFAGDNVYDQSTTPDAVNIAVKKIPTTLTVEYNAFHDESWVGGILKRPDGSGINNKEITISDEEGYLDTVWTDANGAYNCDLMIPVHLPVTAHFAGDSMYNGASASTY